ncbi:hypothetical protein L6164_036201 [Bauhinia variegata]|uniref:Uncharacterized protein n=1 Tax=Bauhinia variegata TaxID=167791 RepID=A0ACB9KGB7_BAUVA|nr:hypothetical protein L6164_036201 [Bauhinia variegata]
MEREKSRQRHAALHFKYLSVLPILFPFYRRHSPANQSLEQIELGATLQNHLRICRAYCFNPSPSALHSLLQYAYSVASFGKSGNDSSPGILLHLKLLLYYDVATVQGNSE